SKDGKALLACDMHLELAIPNIWYRAAFHYQENKEDVHIFGVTIPGAPLMIIGSNTHIAWGFTNAHLNTSSIIVVDPTSTQTVVEMILVKDKAPFAFEIKESAWGPILPQTFFGNRVSLSWIAHSPEALNLQLLQLEKVKDVQSALNASKAIKVPVLNFLVADRNSNIAWTLIGAIPNQNPDDYPVVLNPIDHAIWSANNRTLGGEWLSGAGGESYLNGIRAYQIQQGLLNFREAAPKDMLALQMEIKAPFFERWQRLLIEILQSGANSQKQQELLSVIQAWNGRSAKESAAYYWIRLFRERISTAILERVLAPCLDECHDFLAYFQDFEEPAWLIAQHQPSYLADPKHNSWNEEFLSHIDRMMMSIELAEIKNQIWGNQNRLAMNHPFSSAFPGLGYLLDMPSIPMSGDYYVPKVVYCNDGASQRMVVSPGNESEGIFHMPGGQSSHFLSSFFRAGHEAWVKGEATPFLPGKPVHKLTFQPARK
ncbi:MAG: penicillin acylase family protein, partial [Parachlamydiaceae bacterium]|nr:penicillin acylase family protein [Parachlamydiaceae bacterium]